MKRDRAISRRSRFLARHIATTITILVAIASGPGGRADAADFTGKQIRIIVPGAQAAAYDLYAQLAAQHLGRFIPGNPTIVIAYMPGAAGLNAMNYLYELAPRDGTAIAVLRQDLALQQALGTKGVRFDAAKFNYIGRATANVPVHMVWHTAPAQSIDELKKREVVHGSVGTVGVNNDFPRAVNALLGTKWKVIGGYRGLSETRIAMERGEVQATMSPATLFNERLKPWLAQGKVKVIVQYADFRHPIFPAVPALLELAENQEAKDVFKFLVTQSTVGRAYAAPPDVPAETVAILRKAFAAMVNDPAFRADAEKRGADLLPMPGEELAAYIAGIVRTPPDVIRKTNEVIAAQ